MNRFPTLLFFLLLSLPMAAQQNRDELPRQWGLQFRFGGVTFNDASEDQDFYLNNEDEGNAFALSADYFISRHVALTGELNYEQDGILNDFSDHLGLKKFQRIGVSAGAKWYPLAPKWALQPHIDGLLQTNVCNLTSNKGEALYTAESGYPGSTLHTV